MMLDLFIFAGFWVAFYIIVVGLLFRNTQDWPLTLFLTAVASVLVVTMQIVANNIMDRTYPRAVQEFVVSVKELPIQTLTFEGNTVQVVVVRNRVTPSRDCDRGLTVRRVSHLLPHDATPETAIYLVQERWRVYWIWLIFPREALTDKDPREVTRHVITEEINETEENPE